MGMFIFYACLGYLICGLMVGLDRATTAERNQKAVLKKEPLRFVDSDWKTAYPSPWKAFYQGAILGPAQLVASAIHR